MAIITNLVAELHSGSSISDVLHAQQRYHEERRWSVNQLLDDRALTTFDDRDRAALWHSARAELTTQPAGVRLAIDGVALAKELAKTNPLGAQVAHIAAAWSARFWLEEEAHHEVAYGQLLEMAGLDPIPQDEVVEHRGFFPADNYARVCILQACVEIEACVSYGEMAKTSGDPLVRDVFFQVMRDEVQHRQYFTSFARGLVEAGVYPLKDILSMAYVWVRPGAGETFGSKRQDQSHREGFVNWWEQVRVEPDDGLALRDDQIRTPALHDKKVRSVLAMVREATDLGVTTIEQLKRAYVASLTTNDFNRIRSSIHRGAEAQAVAS